MHVTITAVETAGPGTKARRLVFSEYAAPRLTSASVVKELGLEAGVSMERETLESQLRDAEANHARERALRMLGYRDRSETEVRRALVDDGYPADVAGAIVDRLVEVELIDDARFAHAWVRTRLASGLGPRRIARELTEKGISAEVASSAIADEDQDDAVERARRVLRGRRPDSRAERERFLRKLVARGFDIATALEALGAHDDSDSGDHAD